MNPTITRRRQVGVASGVVLALVAAAFTWFAIAASGEVVRKTDLHDGGVWVSNTATSTFGRLNKPADQLDAGVASAQDAAGSGLDVLQDGSAVVGLSKAANQVVPVSAASATLVASGALTLPAPAKTTGLDYARQLPIDLRGGTAAVVDPSTGRLWAQRTTADAGAAVSLDRLQPQAKPLVTVGAGAVVAVGTDGTVYAASATTGKLATLRVDPVTHDLAAPVPGSVGFTSKALELTVVGTRWVAFDPATGRLTADGLARAVEVDGDGTSGDVLVQAALQQPGPAADSVLAATASGLQSVSLTDDGGSGTVVALPDVARSGASGSAVRLLLSAPVRLGSCVHAAWAAPASVFYGRACGAAVDGGSDAPGGQPVQAVQLTGLGKGTRTDGVKLRTNRGLVVLNDLDTGSVWDLDNTPIKIDNWDSVIPPPQQKDQNTKKDPNRTDDQVVKTPPKALPDEMRVRPGRTSTLHVLDNDSDAAGSILAIAPGDVTQPSVGGVTTAVSGDGQAVEVTLPSSSTATSFSFSYTVNNGGGGAQSRSTAKVSVQVVDDTVNTPPTVRTGSAALSTARYAVVQGGQVTVGVVADYRDAESDPLSVEADDPGTGVDSSGALTVTGGQKAGPVAVGFHVGDGHGGSTAGKATVTVLGDDARPVPPLPQADVVRTVVGKPTQVQPLGNDVPGADPTYPDARMRLAAAVRGPGQLTLDTNLDTDVVTISGSVPGSFFLTYGAQVGTAVGTGRIRVDVLPDPKGDPAPVAVPDSATLRGELPVVTDVLVNDYSPRGDVLVVQKVTTDDPALRASVVQGRYLRVQATSPLTGVDQRRAALTYTVSDGTKTALGQLSVVQKPPAGPLVPHVEDDQAVVRTGDVVTIPVLDNDSVSGGVPLVLDREVRVVAGQGRAFASGTVVRFVPDATPVTADTVVTLEYSTHPEGGSTSVTGRVEVTVKPLPTPTTPDQAPVARSFTASVTAGDTITLTVPTSGIDPDGDLGSVVGVVGAREGAVDLELGRVVSTGASTIRYEAYPRSAGTELIRYSIRDRFGKTGEAVIRVGVVQPGDPQPPVAVEDDVVAAPGRTVTFDPMANDLIAPDDQVDYEDLAARNDADVLRDFTRNADGTFSTKVPAEDSPRVLAYGITDGLFDPSRASVTVRGRAGFNNPPIAVDDTPQPKAGEPSVLVDVLANDRDPDGPQDALRVVSATGEGVTVVGRQVRVTLVDHPRVVPYVVEDGDGAQALAFVYVPTAESGVPFVKPGTVVQMDANSSKKVDLRQLVTDPRGRTIRVTSPDTVSTSPRADVGQALTGAAEVTLTSRNDYVGPAALMLQVTDTTGPGDTTAVTSYLSIPVQVGPLTPVLRCPDYGLALVADGPARTVDVPRLCHAWFPTGLDPATVQYDASWATRLDRVDLTQGGTGGSELSLRAQPGAPDGNGTLTYGLRGGQQFTLRVQVTRAPPLTVRPISLDGLVAGQSQTVDVGRSLDSPLSAPRCVLSGVRTVTGAGITATASGCRITVTAAGSARRQATIAFRASDAPGRSADGQVAVTIKAPPDAPTGVVAAADQVAGGQARVSWRAPGYDGGFPVNDYRVTAVGQRTQTCTASPCTVTGLTNGVAVTFTVAARNAVGFSPDSAASNAAKPDKRPERTVVGRITPGDRTLTVTWSPPAVNGGSAVTGYQLVWVDKDGGSGGGDEKVLASAGTSYVIRGLKNDDRYGVTIRARNDLGYGPPGPEVVGQSVGKPKTPGAPTLTPSNPAPEVDYAEVTITWAPVDPNGPPITRYTVFRDGQQIWQSGGPGELTHTDSVPYDGARHLYTIEATNGGGKTSDASAPATFDANGVPQTPSVGQVTTPASDYAAVASWTVGNSHSSGYQALKWRTSTNSGSFDCTGGTCPTGGKLGGLGTTPNQDVEIQVVNAAGTASAWSAPSSPVDPYGPTNGLTGLTETHNGNSITFTWNATPTNGRAIDHYQLGGDGTGASTSTSFTFSGLGYNTSRTLTVTPVAVDSGPGTAQSATGTTDQPPPPTIKVVHGTQCAPLQCTFIDSRTGQRVECTYYGGGRCFHLRFEVHNWTSGVAKCLIDQSGQVDEWGYVQANVSADGTFDVVESPPRSGAPFFGFRLTLTPYSCNVPGFQAQPNAW